MSEIVPQNGKVLLTWEDLWVTASSLKDGNKAILKGLTGYAKPSELLAIMGPSGCGKSTLLDTIAGRLGSSTRQSGDILINGRKQTLAYGTSEGEVLEKRSRASFAIQSLVLTKRSFVNMYRDLGYYWMRLAVYIVIAVGLGTIYYDVGFSYTSIQSRGSMLMFVATFITFMAIGGFSSFVEELKVFQREKLNGHYGSGSFVIANTLSAMPYLVLVSFIPGAIAYFLTGLQGGFEHFMCFAVVLFTCMMLVESLMMIVASIVPNFLMGLISGAGIQALNVLKWRILSITK